MTGLVVLKKGELVYIFNKLLLEPKELQFVGGKVLFWGRKMKEREGGGERGERERERFSEFN